MAQMGFMSGAAIVIFFVISIQQGSCEHKKNPKFKINVKLQLIFTISVCPALLETHQVFENIV